MLKTFALYVLAYLLLCLLPAIAPRLGTATAQATKSTQEELYRQCNREVALTVGTPSPYPHIRGRIAYTQGALQMIDECVRRKKESAGRTSGR